MTRADIPVGPCKPVARDRSGNSASFANRLDEHPPFLVASDYAITPVAATDPAPYPKPASGPDLAKAARAITERIQAARSVAVLHAYTVSRFKLQRSLQALIEALGCPFAVTPMEKGVLSETHAQFAGMYMGAGSSPSLDFHGATSA